MYILDKQDKKLTAIQNTTFSDLGLKERQDLQKWINQTPAVLGEELLIIQEEFDEFDKTRERLDLLALDKNGNLVIIENKLDDSGRDVTWQALKYVSYCSSLNKHEIVDIFQRYIDKCKLELNAQSEICTFLEADDFESVILNQGFGQRLILVAHEFRQEVTSTVVWLRENGIDIRCVRIIPYILQQNGRQEIIIDIDQIIPVPEIEQYQIRLAQKEAEEKQSSTSRLNTANLYSEYWSLFLKTAIEREFFLFKSRKTNSDNWLGVNSCIPFIIYSLDLLKNRIRAGLYINHSQADVNKRNFDYLYNHKTEIETRFGQALEWLQQDDKKNCRIYIADNFSRDERDEWDLAIDWHITQMRNLEQAVKPFLEQLANQKS